MSCEILKKIWILGVVGDRKPHETRQPKAMQGGEYRTLTTRLLPPTQTQRRTPRAMRVSGTRQRGETNLRSEMRGCGASDATEKRRFGFGTGFFCGLWSWRVGAQASTSSNKSGGEEEVVVAA